MSKHHDPFLGSVFYDLAKHYSIMVYVYITHAQTSHMHRTSPMYMVAHTKGMIKHLHVTMSAQFLLKHEDIV